MSFENKKKKIELYGFLYSISEEMKISHEDIERFAENIEVDASDIHDVLYKLAENDLITEEMLNSYLDAADEL